MVTMGISALRSACLKVTMRSDRPLARAVLQKSPPNARTSRMTAMGMMGQTLPNRITSRMPFLNTGIE